jgi:hypothetical protein
MGVQLRSALEAAMDRIPPGTPRSRSQSSAAFMRGGRSPSWQYRISTAPRLSKRMPARGDGLRRWRCRTSRSPLFACGLLDFDFKNGQVELTSSSINSPWQKAAGRPPVYLMRPPPLPLRRQAENANCSRSWLSAVKGPYGCSTVRARLPPEAGDRPSSELL